MQSVSFILIFYGCIVGRKRYTLFVYCNDIEELVAMVHHHRSQETNEVNIKLSVDKGQGFLKVTLSITIKPELENNKIKPELENKKIEIEQVTEMRGKVLKIHVSTKLLYWPFYLKKYHSLRIILD